MFGLLGLLGIAGFAGLVNNKLYPLSSLSFLSYIAYFRFFRSFFGLKIDLSQDKIPIFLFSLFPLFATFFMSNIPAVGFLGFLGFLGYTLDIKNDHDQKLNDAEQIDEIILSGGGAQLPWLKDILSEKHEIEFKLNDAVARIEKSDEMSQEDVAELEKVAPLLTVSMGLALRRGDK